MSKVRVKVRWKEEAVEAELDAVLVIGVSEKGQLSLRFGDDCGGSRIEALYKALMIRASEEGELVGLMALAVMEASRDEVRQLADLVKNLRRDT